MNAVSVEKEPRVDEMLQLLRAIDRQGPAHMDVLYDPADDTYKLLEVNPRFWMPLNLSIRSGVGIPALLFELIKGKPLERISKYDVGIEYRWVFPNEILWVISNDDKKTAARQLLSISHTGVCYGTVSWDDPVPLAGMVAQSIRFLSDDEKRKVIFDRGWEHNDG